MARIASTRRVASTARVPAVPAGTALVVTRYGEEKAVVLHPDDFHRLRRVDNALEELASEPPAFSELVSKGHALEDAPGMPVEDPDAIRSLLRS